MQGSPPPTAGVMDGLNNNAFYITPEEIEVTRPQELVKQAPTEEDPWMLSPLIVEETTAFKGGKFPFLIMYSMINLHLFLFTMHLLNRSRPRC